MSDRAPSDRRQIADRFAEFIIANDIANPFGGEVNIHESAENKRKKHYAIPMSRPRLLDGEVRVYGPKFILVLMRGALALGGEERVYASEAAAMAFLRLLLVEHKTDEALAIPTKAPRASS
jgi:hypothetical protein